MAEIELNELPQEVEFQCHQCRSSCKMFPRTRAVVHAKPTCAMWKRVMLSQRDLLPLFLIRSGVEVVRLNPA